MKKGLRDFSGYAKKSSDFFGQTNFEVVIFLGLNMNLSFFLSLNLLGDFHPVVKKKKKQ